MDMFTLTAIFIVLLMLTTFLYIVITGALDHEKKKKPFNIQHSTSLLQKAPIWKSVEKKGDEYIFIEESQKEKCDIYTFSDRTSFGYSLPKSYYFDAPLELDGGTDTITTGITCIPACNDSKVSQNFIPDDVGKYCLNSDDKTKTIIQKQKEEGIPYCIISRDFSDDNKKKLSGCTDIDQIAIKKMTYKCTSENGCLDKFGNLVYKTNDIIETSEICIKDIPRCEGVISAICFSYHTTIEKTDEGLNDINIWENRALSYAYNGKNYVLGLETLDTSRTSQRFRISRYRFVPSNKPTGSNISFDKKGNWVYDEKGAFCQIYHRETNSYLDYDGKKLVFTKRTKPSVEEGLKWLILPSMELTPKMIGENHQRCNYSLDNYSVAEYNSSITTISFSNDVSQIFLNYFKEYPADNLITFSPNRVNSILAFTEYKVLEPYLTRKMDRDNLYVSTSFQVFAENPDRAKDDSNTITVYRDKTVVNKGDIIIPDGYYRNGNIDDNFCRFPTCPSKGYVAVNSGNIARTPASPDYPILEGETFKDGNVVFRTVDLLKNTVFFHIDYITQLLNSKYTVDTNNPIRLQSSGYNTNKNTKFLGVKGDSVDNPGPSPPQIGFIEKAEDLLKLRTVLNSVDDLITFFTTHKNANGTIRLDNINLRTLQYTELNYLPQYEGKTNADIFLSSDSDYIKDQNTAISDSSDITLKIINQDIVFQSKVIKPPTTLPVLGKFIPYTYFKIDVDENYIYKQYNTLPVKCGVFNYSSDYLAKCPMYFNYNRTQFIPYGGDDLFSRTLNDQALPNF